MLLLPLCGSCQNKTTTKERISKKIDISDNLVGGPFENRDFMFVDMPQSINSVDTSAAWDKQGKKLLITGTIYEADGKTPAPGVILYYYHTDTEGLYADAPGLNPKVKRHGYIRGWVRSDEHGNYSIYTLRPGAYPNAEESAHIHLSIKEPDIEQAYWIDELVFDDDPLLTTEKRTNLQNRGGSGILRLLKDSDLLLAEHDIILGLNIPNYPVVDAKTNVSGKEIGEDIISFMPYHAFGLDKGSKTCPVSKYGRYHGILYFVGNNPDWKEIEKWLLYFENEAIERAPFLKVYFVYGNNKDFKQETIKDRLEKLGSKLALKNVALTFVPSFTDKASEIHYNKINQEVGNTILVYKNSRIIDKYIDIPPDSVNIQNINVMLDSSSEFFHLKTIQPSKQ